MRRRYRKSFRRKGRRLYRRRKTVARKALRIARSVNRKMAAEVRKLDWNAIIPESDFQQLSPAFGTSNDKADSLPDYGYLYPIFSSSNGMVQGVNINDFAGNQVRAKYLYLGIHLQMPNRPTGLAADPTFIQQPLCIRIMIVQDTSLTSGSALGTMVFDLFGVGMLPDSTNPYMYKADFTLLPINPRQPGRFNVIRDFKMYVSPGYRQDYYKKVMLLQRDLKSSGRFYASKAPNNQPPPDDGTAGFDAMRNNIYVLLFYQSPTLYGDQTTGSPDFTISLQSRLAYYDN